jgi:serine/threonine-protein kinase
VAAPLRRLGSYQLVAPLATGGMAELFIAKTGGVSGFEKQVALKVIHPNFSNDPDFVKMLVDEAKLAVQLQHANIVQTYDLGQVGGQYYIAMELVDGADLYKILKTGSERSLDFPIDVAAFVTSEVANGLDYAHRKNDPMGRPLQIVHRDVSPQNVLVSFEGEIKIVDFGIAKAALRGQQTMAGVIKGKYYYMSPEQAWGDKIDARTDVFSTGILLHEMLVGEMLYLEEDLEALLRLVRAADIQPPSRKRPDVPADLDAIVMKALAKRPADRFQSAADLASALTRFLRQRYPDFGRSRVTGFVREVLQKQEHSRTDLTPPPARSEFGDENSLIFDAKKQRRVSPREAHKPAPTARGRDEHTVGVGAKRSDYEDIAATEFDPKPSAAMRGGGTDPDTPIDRPHLAQPIRAGFRDAGTDAEPTSLAPGRRPPSSAASPVGFASSEDEAPTSLRPERSVSPPSPSPSPSGDRGRRASIPPSPMGRRGTLPPLAQPPPSTSPRGPVGLGVSEPDPSSPRLETGLTPTSPTPSPSPTGSTPLVDWNVAPTVTPHSSATPYARSGSDFQLISSGVSAPDMRRRKLFFIAGLMLLIAVVVLGIALVWPDGPQRGSIEVVSVPPGATVRIDGTVLSKLTPIRISDVELRQPHRIAVSLRGFDTWENDARFDTGERDIRLQAVLVPAVGTLEVITVPAGAEAIVNGRISGTTPTKVGDLPPNEDVTLELRLRGYKVVYKTLQWAGKRSLSVSVPLEKAK